MLKTWCRLIINDMYNYNICSYNKICHVICCDCPY